MKTSKEMQLKIIDKMRENVEIGKLFYQGLEYKNYYDDWVDEEGCIRMDDLEYRIKPSTITINGVEIPKPLTREEFKVRAGDDPLVYYPIPHSHLYGSIYAVVHDFKEGDILYGNPSIAIEASKLLFGIKE